MPVWARSKFTELLLPTFGPTCYCGVMADKPQQIVVEFESGPVAFHCAIHGTVLRCPWRWMDCQATGTPDLNPRQSWPDWLDQSWRTKARGE